MGVEQIGAGELAGALNRSVVDCESTFLTMILCGSPTKPSIRHFTFRVAAPCDVSYPRVCVPAGHSACRAPERDDEVKSFITPRGNDQ